jgi:hypothetical protein
LGSLEKRLASLEERFRMWRGSEEDEERALITQKAIERLSLIELMVLEEVLELKAANPDLPGDEIWRLMTDTQQAMEPEWRRVVREVRSELEASA